MKSFLQYITEKPTKLSATYPYKGAKWFDFRGYENPTEKEMWTLLKKARYGTVRFVVDAKGKMWMWDGNDGLHDAVIFAQTGEKYDGNYAKGDIQATNKTNAGSGPATNLKIIVHNTRTVGTDFALKNKTLKALAKRINSKDDDIVYWVDAAQTDYRDARK
jgi:hypothetical protein